MFRVLLLQYGRPIGIQIINNGMGCRPSSCSCTFRKVLSYVHLLCLIGYTNYNHLSFIETCNFRGWIPRSWFDMEGYNDNYTHNYKWGTINEHFSVNTRIDNSGKCLVGSCCRRSCWWRFTSVYCQVRKIFDAQLLTHMYIYYIN